PTPVPAATALSQFSIEEAESTIAIAEQATALPMVGNIDVDSRPRPPSAGAPTVRFATIALLVVFGGFIGGCTMVMVLRSRRTAET
ncbi:MAG TPA: hypothetical protein VM450_19640, partial [Thermomicrobiales bacterium]|nr:hypothetical protein [Thermomicrobiales bacterium]